MNTFLPDDDIEIHRAFDKIHLIENFSLYIKKMSNLISTNDLDRKKLENILKEHSIRGIEEIKEEIIDLLLFYINIILNDNIITEKEADNVNRLKRFFKTEEGDFYRYRYKEVLDILNKQFERINENNEIDTEEALHKVMLQELFDLSYDQFLGLVDREVRAALQRGANVFKLDTVIETPKVTLSQASSEEINVSQETRDLVWDRNKGKCSICGSEEQLEFDYILPISTGGQNVPPNIQLLCGQCMQKKINKI
jgi:hypothetical protein